MPLRMGDQTAGMSVMDARLGDRGPLATFIAERRTPGDGWRSYEEIADEMAGVTGIPVTRPGIQRWAERLGIPDTARDDDPARREAYVRAVGRYLRAPRGGRTV